MSKVFLPTFSTEKVGACGSAGPLNLLRSKSSTKIDFNALSSEHGKEITTEYNKRLWLSWIERSATNRKVGGSNPSRRILKNSSVNLGFLYFDWGIRTLFVSPVGRNERG